jgi:hypothetical protein
VQAAAAIVNNVNEESKENPAEKSHERTTSPALFPLPNPPASLAKPPAVLDVKDIAPHILEQVNNSIKFGRSHSTSQG